jgi:hypothetical protein
VRLCEGSASASDSSGKGLEKGPRGGDDGTPPQRSAASASAEAGTHRENEDGLRRAGAGAEGQRRQVRFMPTVEVWTCEDAPKYAPARGVAPGRSILKAPTIVPQLRLRRGDVGGTAQLARRRAKGPSVGGSSEGVACARACRGGSEPAAGIAGDAPRGPSYYARVDRPEGVGRASPPGPGSPRGVSEERTALWPAGQALVGGAHHERRESLGRCPTLGESGPLPYSPLEGVERASSPPHHRPERAGVAPSPASGSQRLGAEERTALRAAARTLARDRHFERREGEGVVPPRGDSDRAPRVLHLFSGRPRADGTLRSALRARGWDCVEVDKLLGAGNDLLDDKVHASLLRRAEAGEFRALVAGVPCQSFSLLGLRARRRVRGTHVGVRLRTRQAPLGRAGLSRKQREYLQRHNALVERAVDIARAVWGAGGEFLIENVADRGEPGSRLFAWRYRHHVPLWLMPAVRRLARTAGAALLSFPQCRLGGDFQKWTSVLVTGALRDGLRSWGALRCTHGTHARQAVGAAARAAQEYPRRMLSGIVDALVGERTQGPSEEQSNEDAARLFLAEAPCATGAGEDEAALVECRAAVDKLPPSWPEVQDFLGPAAKAKFDEELSYSSRRRAEAAPAAELLDRPYPDPSPEAELEWTDLAEYAWPEGAPSPPVAVHALFQEGVYEEITLWLEQARAALAEWRAGRQCKPPPDRTYGQECMRDWARGVVWDARDPSACVPVQRSSRVDPPESYMNVGFFDEWSRRLHCTDTDMIEQVARGVESRARCELTTVLMMHHAGVRKHYGAVQETVEADSAAERRWVSQPYVGLPYVPCRLVAKNVAEQQKWKLDEGGELTEVCKLRVTTDDSAEVEQLTGEAKATSHNNALPREEWCDTRLPGPRTLAEAVAITKAVDDSVGVAREAIEGERVALWAMDLSDAFRSLPGQRAEKWMHCFVWCDGVRVDERCVFGSAHMVGLFQRVTTFVLRVVAARIRLYDAEHPYSAARRLWCAHRSDRLGSEQGCHFQMVYLDDAMGLTVLSEGEELRGPPGAESRAQAHLRIAQETFIEAGWGVAAAKLQLGFRIDPLGLSITTEGPGAITCPEAKRRGLIADIDKQLMVREAKGTSRSARRRRVERGGAVKSVPREEVERLTGRCLHLAMVEPGANPYLQPLYRMSCATRKVKSPSGGVRLVRPKLLAVIGSSPAQRAYEESLLWWRARLCAGLVVPLAPRLVFPSIGEAGCLVVCTDAAREEGAGFGGYAPVEVGGVLTFYYVEARWPEDILLALQGNRISMPAGEMLGMAAMVVACLAELEAVHHVVTFTDSDATRATMNSGASPAPQLNAIVQWMLAWADDVQFLAIHQKGARNEAADGISRDAASKVLEEVKSVGWRVQRLELPEGFWELCRSLLWLPPAVPCHT